MSDTELYSIKETSEKTGLSEDTIRYYEKIELLPRAKRKGNTHRVYRSEDLFMMKIITCLKKTGMSLDEIRPYMNLSSFNDDLTASPELYELLQEHKKKIENQMASLQQIMDLIDSKLLQGNVISEPCTITGGKQTMPMKSREDKTP
ncbi:DNA-binding transcriptional MerR regulator [Paenibacillus castaneae]|uniref:MerR family transcriptional regulator n=1 Tax=Paenibacillus castaneae TaxID=474957 RepID=UPI000C9AE60D|nr:MerR family transcriptional regulator [Paenibacillus castaneae]NIK77178.1 DNA-binding transcriptional MerR regulator [Paenibacillus castaneae]